MKVVIAEKPSVAREIAAILNATEKKTGYFAGKNYCVTWALGHLIGLAMPQDYGHSGFVKDSLPIIPNPFRLMVRKVTKGKVYVEDPSASAQLKVIANLVRQCDSIIVATDAGREGELIFRYIYQYLNCKKSFERLWISSLTEKAIQSGFENLKAGNDFDGLFEAAKSRSRADWLIGINASQALSIAAGNGIYSLGRVQTPTLGLICKRYLENKNFEIKNYWQIRLHHRKDFIDFSSQSKLKWGDKKKAEAVLQSLSRTGTVRVTEVEHKNFAEQPPLLFDLTGLQKEANKKLNLSADQTLGIAQSLYEKKFITYPRTGSKYITEDLWSEIPNLIRALGDNEFFKPHVAKMNWGRFNKRIVNDVKVTDHHGLLVTEKVPSALPPADNAIYRMIALRLLESISAVCSKTVTDVTLEILYFDFKIKGINIVDPGWRGIQGDFSEDEDDGSQKIPDLKKGDELKIKEAILLEKKTKPPVIYTEASLLSAMERAGPDSENEEEKKVMQEIGIGTPATRASIIETLFSRGYIQRQNKLLIPSEKGLSVYEIVKDMKIASVAMTAEWELAFHEIEAGKMEAGFFQNEMEQYAGMVTRELLDAEINDAAPTLICPLCKQQQLVIRDNLVKCPDKNCDWVQFRNICGVQIDVAQIEKLVTIGKTDLIKSMKSTTGKKFDAYIMLQPSGKTSFEFENKKKR